MAELDKIPQKQSIEIELVKLDENVLNSITELNQKAAAIIQEFGKVYVRKKEIEEQNNFDDLIGRYVKVGNNIYDMTSKCRNSSMFNKRSMEKKFKSQMFKEFTCFRIYRLPTVL